MTGTQTGNSMPTFLYETLVFFCILLFAVYDIRWKRVSDRALVFFCLMAAIAPFIRTGVNGGLLPLGMTVMVAALGAVSAFCILLMAAMISRGGTGIGGGDIKLAAAMGFIYGPSQISLILLLASFFAAIAAGVIRMGRKKEQLSLPFVPYLAFGNAVVTAIQIIR